MELYGHYAQCHVCQKKNKKNKRTKNISIVLCCLMIWGCFAATGPGKLAVIKTTIDFLDQIFLLCFLLLMSGDLNVSSPTPPGSVPHNGPSLSSNHLPT